MMGDQNIYPSGEVRSIDKATGLVAVRKTEADRPTNVPSLHRPEIWCASTRQT